jgi:hypothetical protein
MRERTIAHVAVLAGMGKTKVIEWPLDVHETHTMCVCGTHPQRKA